jgi:hypothetical protein
MPVAVRSKICGSSISGIAGSNPTDGMSVCPLCLFCMERPL